MSVLEAMECRLLVADQYAEAANERIEQLEVQNKRYAEALRAIVEHDGVSYRFGDEVRSIAHEALNPIGGSK